MKSALVSLINEINEEEAKDHPEPILVTEDIIREITNGLSVRAFCTTFGVSATREYQGKSHEYLALSPRKDTQLSDRL